MRKQDHLEPLAPRFLLRKHLRPLVIVPIQCSWPGWRDGRLQARLLRREAAPDGVPSLGPTLWMARNRHTFAERDRLEYLEAESAVAGVRVRLARLTSEAAAAAATMSTAEGRRREIGEGPDAMELSHRDAAETRTSRDVVAMRRRREHASRLAAADQTVAEALASLSRLECEIAQAQALLEAAFQAATTRSERLREYYERRAAVYRRGHQRGWQREVRRASRHVDDSAWPLYSVPSTLEPPAWTKAPCPWVAAPVAGAA